MTEDTVFWSVVADADKFIRLARRLIEGSFLRSTQANLPSSPTDCAGLYRAIREGTLTCRRYVEHQCREVVSDSKCGTAPLPDDLLLNPASYDAAVQLIEGLLLPLLEDNAKGGIVHLTRALLLTFSLDREIILRARTTRDTDMSKLGDDEIHALIAISASTLLASGGVTKDNNNSTQTHTHSNRDAAPLPMTVGPRTVLVASDTALQVATTALLAPTANQGLALLELTHDAFFWRESATFLCVCTATNDVLIDLLSTARDAIKSCLGPLLASCDGKPKVIYGTDTARRLRRDFGIALTGTTDVLFLARVLELPLTSISGLRRACVTSGSGEDGRFEISSIESSSASNGGGYFLHDSLYRPAQWAEIPPFLQAFVHDCRNLLPLEISMRRLCCELKGESCYRYMLSVAADLEPSDQGTNAEQRVDALLRNRGCSLPAVNLSTPQRRVMQALWSWRQRQAKHLGLSPTTVATNACLVFLAIVSPSTVPELSAASRIFPTGRPIHILFDSVTGVVATAVDVGPVPGHLAVSSSLDLADDLALDLDLDLGIDAGVHTFGNAPATPIASIQSNGQSAARRAAAAASPAPYMLGNTGTAGGLLGGGDPERWRPVRMASPVQPAEDVFRFAGWSTPVPLDQQGRNSPRPFSPYGAAASIASASSSSSSSTAATTTAAAAATATSPYGITAFSVSSTVPPVAGAETGPGTIAIDDPADAGSADLAFRLVALPNTYEEIFEISNRNRRRNKDRAGKGETGLNSSIESLGSLDGATPTPLLQAPLDRSSTQVIDAFDGTVFDEAVYFSTQLAPSLLPPLTNVAASASTVASSVSSGGGVTSTMARTSINVTDAALDFSLSLGWLSGETVREQVKKSHLQDFSVHACNADGSIIEGDEDGWSGRAAGGGGGGSGGGGDGGKPSSKQGARKKQSNS